MATDNSIEQIGVTAGLVWRALSDNGPLSITKLAKAVEVPRDTLLQAIGWLAREDKILFDDKGRTRTVGLKPVE